MAGTRLLRKAVILSSVVDAITAALAHPIKRVVVAGGTHGNEFTGVYGERHHHAMRVAHLTSGLQLRLRSS